MDVAKASKADEWYTELVDIEQEMKFYKKHFKGKTVFLNCDDPYESNFFKYFALNFSALQLKRLIATSWYPSPIAGNELPLGEIEGLRRLPVKEREPFAISITKVLDSDGSGATDLTDVETLMRHDGNVVWRIFGDGRYDAGDFRSRECVQLLDEADIVITNPPFSLFREFVGLLLEKEKHFIVMGNRNAITYKDLWSYFIENRLWLGVNNGGNKWFRVLDNSDLKTETRKKVVDGKLYSSSSMVFWYTNLEHRKRTEELPLFKKYSPEEHPRYANRDAIHINTLRNIPVDWDGEMGVPITFMASFNPNQFEIVKFRKGDDDKDLRLNIDGMSKEPFFRILVKRKL